MPLVQVKDLVVEYPGPVKALDGVSLALEKGEIVCLLGANGAGKTTLIKTLSGLVMPKRGEIRWHTSRGACPRAGVLLEGSRAFYWNMTGWENAMYFSALKGLPQQGLEAHLNDLFQLVGLSEARHRLAGDYSSGMKKRLSLLIALVGSPELLMLDEPTAGLDRGSVLEFENYLRRVAAEEGAAILCATHKLSFAFTVASRIMYLENGRLRTWDWENVLGRHRRAMFLLGGALPEDRAAIYQGHLRGLGENRWQLEGATDDPQLFRVLDALISEHDLHLLQMYGVD